MLQVSWGCLVNNGAARSMLVLVISVAQKLVTRTAAPVRMNPPRGDREVYQAYPISMPGYSSMSPTAPRRSNWTLLICLAAVFATAAIGAKASANAATFYAQLDRPAWAPPAAVFGPVWTLLFLLMAVAAWLVWRVHGDARVRPALTLFGIHLVANGLWSWLFFAWRLGAVASIEVVVLWILIALTTVSFWRIRPWAGVLLLPYLMWVGYAAALTMTLWQRNPEVLG